MTLNKAMVIGRVGRDPEVRYTKSGAAVASLSVATSEAWKDAQGNRKEQTEWHNIVAWGKLATFCEEYIRKGREVYVEGRIQTRDWTDKDNVKHYKTEINAQVIRFVGPRPADDVGPGGQEHEAPKGNANAPDDGAFEDDDIPF